LAESDQKTSKFGTHSSLLDVRH